MSGTSLVSSSKNANSASNGLETQTTSGTVHGTGMQGPLNADQITQALGYASAPLFHGMNGETDAAQAAMFSGADRAMGTAGQGAGYLGNTLAGNYLNSNPANRMLQPIADGSADGRWSNPYADAAFDSAASKIEGRMRGAWGGSDVRPGGGLQQAALGGALADLGTGIYLPTAQAERGYQMGAIDTIGSNYAGERANQQGAASMIPGQVGATIAPGAAYQAAAYKPLETYVNALAAISPGQTSTRDIATSGTMSGTTNSNGSTSGNGKSTGLSI